MSTRYRAEGVLRQRIASRRALRRHLLVSVALVVVAVAGSVSDVRGASALFIATAATSGLFAVGLRVAGAGIRDAAIAAIARGDVAAVASVAPADLSALTCEAHRRHLVEALARCLRPSGRLYGDGLATARTHLRRQPSARLEIQHIMRALERGGASPIGTALVHQLVTDAGSPLRAGTPDQLRRDLSRIRYVLGPAPGAVANPENAVRDSIELDS